jgi:predicted DNA-binding transcriptional regulator AlpA
MESTQKSTTKMKRLLSLRDTAEETGLCEKTIWNNMVPRGTLVVVRVGARVLFDRNDLDAWIQRHKTGGASDDS